MPKLSATILDAAIAKSRSEAISDRTVWCSSVSGFGARIRSSGRATFILQYRNRHGQQRKYVIGRYGALTIHQAREIATRKRGEIAQGFDPATEKIAAKTGDTMKDLAAVYLERYASKKRSGYKDRGFIERSILPKFGPRKIESITFTDIKRFHASYGAPVAANRCLALLSRMFWFAKEEGMVKDPRWVNPAKDVKKNPERTRDRYIYESEMPRLLDATFAIDDKYLRASILFALFTGVRRGALFKLRWGDIDFENGTFIERMAKQAKAGELIAHHMTTATKEILLDLGPKKPSDFVFLHKRSAKSYEWALRKTWESVKKEAKINEEVERLWFHDLRKTVGSWMAKENFSSNLIKNALKHKTLQASQRYQHIKDGSAVLDAMEHINQKILDSRNPT